MNGSNEVETLMKREATMNQDGRYRCLAAFILLWLKLRIMTTTDINQATLGFFKSVGRVGSNKSAILTVRR